MAEDASASAAPDPMTDTVRQRQARRARQGLLAYLRAIQHCAGDRLLRTALAAERHITLADPAMPHAQKQALIATVNAIERDLLPREE